jgi:hypothetical protein
MTEVYLRNCTKDPRSLTARNGPGMLVFSLAAGEVKAIDTSALKKLRSNVAVEKLFSAKLISVVPGPEIKVATPVKASPTPVPTPKVKPKKRKVKKTKSVDIGI